MWSVTTRSVRPYSATTVCPVARWERKCCMPSCAKKLCGKITWKCDACGLCFCIVRVNTCARCSRSVCDVCVRGRIGFGATSLSVRFFHRAVRALLDASVGSWALCVDCVIPCQKCGGCGFPPGWLQCKVCGENVCEQCMIHDPDRIDGACHACHVAEDIIAEKAARQLVALTACK